MAGENEPARLLLPYLQRADELQKHEPLVAYYCRLYGMERGLKIPQSARTKTTNALLISLMNQLEKDKKTVELGPDDNLHIEGFALNVFAKADKQDRAGRADLNTAKTFYAASLFFEVLNQFGAVPPDLEQKQKYAVWKAADIRKALKEGRKPVPGPPGGEEDLSVPSNDDYDLESRTSQTPDDLEQRRPDVSFQSIDPRSDPTMGHGMPIDFPAPPRHDPSRSDPTMGHVMPTDFPAPPRHDPSIRPGFEPDSASPHNLQHSSSFAPPHNLQHSPSFPTSHSLSHSPNIPPSNDYPSQTYQPPPTNAPENYSHLYHQQSYQNEAPQQHLPHQQYQPQEPPAYTLPNFQSYPSFSESSLPTAPTNYASYYQGADVSYSTQPPAPSAADYPSSNQHNVSAPPIAVVPEVASTVVKTYKYDSSYQPPPEKIAEAHKAARFAVGALAFDDVSIAVDFLQKSLELLTNPSSSSSGH